jgi:hypothetical protein
MNWKVSDENNIVSIIAYGATLCQMSRHRTKESVLIDARLIAAAPDLFEALQAFVDGCEKGADKDEKFLKEYKNALDVIFKATGR